MRLRQGTPKQSGRINVGMLWLFVIYSVLIIVFFWDHSSHGHSGASVSHIAIEFLIMVGAMAAIVFFWLKLTESRRTAQKLSRKLVDVQAQVARWQHEERDVIDRFQSAIDRKFDEWDLNASEKEIAWCLLQGQSMKEIARSRDSTDRSIRQQAYVLYHKAGLTGRAELSAFFLGGLVEGHGLCSADPDSA